MFSSSLEEGDTELQGGLDWRTKPDIQIGKKLKQLELNFSKVLEETEISGDTGEQPKAVVEPEQLVIVETTPEVEAETVAKAKPLYKRMTG